MPIIGIVATLPFEPNRQEAVLSQLKENPFIEVGEFSNPKLPLVLHTECRDDEKRIWKQLNNHPDIVFLDVVYANFEDIFKTNSETEVS